MSLSEYQCTPVALKANCKMTILKNNVTFKILSTTPLSREWLTKKSAGQFDFGANVEFPKEEFAEWKEATTKKFVPRDN